jgi:D-alanyl-D-alanine carboxypeptidase
MYTSILSALLLGVVPAINVSLEKNFSPEQLVISPPAVMMEMRGNISASGVLVMDLEGGQPIFAYQEETKRSMASLTKLMTALIIVENHDLDEWVAVPGEIDDVVGNTVYLPKNSEFTVGDLLYALLIASANDAAETLAVYHSGSREAFVAEMNMRAVVLGLHDTSYANPSGMDSVNQWSTPKDLAWLTTFVLREPAIRERMETRGTQISSKNGYNILLTHTHALLHADNYVKAGKTGTTPKAQQCLISVAEVEGREYVVVLLHSLQRYRDVQNVLRALREHQMALSDANPLLSENAG